MMKKLMNHVLSLPQYRDSKILLQAYNPAIYYTLGFQENYFHQQTLIDFDAYPKNSINALEIINDDDYGMLLNLYNHYCKKFTGYRQRDINYYKNYIIPRCKAYDDKIVLFYKNDSAIGYTIYHKTQDQINVNEIIYLDDDALNQIISYFAPLTSKLVVECDSAAKLIGTSKDICTMMTNFIGDNNQSKLLYINECL